MKMNLKTVLLLVCVPLMLSGSCALAHTDVTPEEAHELIGSTDDLTVVDVREPSEYCDTRGHIPSAVNYPLTSGVLYERYEELTMDGPILVVCRSGGRSNQAATFLDSQGFSMVYDMMGGMNSWIWETELCGEADEKYSGGIGEPNDPYQIATAEDLILLGETPEDYDKHFILTADIDLDPNLPGGKVFDGAVIGTFTGIFDGNGHVISNLWIEGFNHLGLFGQLASGAKISNLGLELIDVDGTGWYVGGLVGENFGSISTSYTTGIVTGVYEVGGLVGRNSAGSITTNYSTVTVTGGWSVVGLVGGNWNGSIATSYSTGLVAGNEDVGGFLGGNYNGSINLCLWDIETSGQEISVGGEGKTTAEMQMLKTFLEAGWDFVGEADNGTEDIWSICEGTNYPRFAWQIPAGDFVCPDGVTIDDFTFFMEHWLDDSCDSSNGYCDGTDLDQSGTVDAIDLEIFFEIWLAEDSVSN